MAMGSKRYYFKLTNGKKRDLIEIKTSEQINTLKKILSTDQLQSFEVGVKYQMYHAILLVALGLNPEYVTMPIYWCITIGIVLFSFSIYGLILSDARGKKLKFLGPITPLGGLLLVTGWLLLCITAF